MSLSAVCKDANNNAVSGVTVTFVASAGLLVVTQGATDDTGTALATLDTGGNQANQTITVTVTSGSVSSSLPIVETGTNLLISGVTVVGSGAQVTYSVTLADSSNAGIPNQTVTLTSALKNGISPATATTNSSGQATFTYTGTTGGSDTLTATSAALNASSTYTTTVSATSLTFSEPTSTNTPIPFNTATQVQTLYTLNGTPQSGITVNFAASRGTLSATSPTLPCTTASGSTPVTSLSVTTDSNGHATLYLCTDGSQGAGATIVTAAVAGNGPSASLPLVFEATTPNSVAVEAAPSTIAPSATSTVKAVVYDANNNLVAGQTVDFTLTDPTGGSLSASSGVTDATGSTSVTYQASSASSAQGGVQISVAVRGTSITSATPAKITVGGQALRVTLGTKNVVSPYETVQYQLPYSVIVTDSAGNPVPSATLNLTIQSIAYQKGFLYYNTTVGEWVYENSSLVPASDPDFNSYPSGEPPPINLLYQNPFGCVTEDPNNTGIYSPSLDYNHNGVLDPGAVASVPSTVALGATTGSAEFEITYPADHALWVEELLTATADVAGTETTATAEFVLPGVASDYTSQTVAPPGQVSPYGDSANDPATYNSSGVQIVSANNCQSPD